MIKLTANDIAKKFGKDIALIKTRTEQLKDVGLGHEFLFGGVEFVVLDDNYDENNNILVIAKMNYDFSILNDTSHNFGQTPIGNGKTAYSVLNNFYEKVRHEFSQCIINKNTNLLSDNGLDDYGTVDKFVTLLTLNEFLKYRHLIPENEDQWWLATPHGTTSSGQHSLCCFIDKDKNVEVTGFDTYIGIRPVLLLSPATFVKTVEVLDTSNLYTFN